MHDEPGTTDDRDDSIDLPPPPTWLGRLFRGVLIVFYSVVFTIVIGTIIGVALQVADIHPDQIGLPVPPEIVGIGFFAVCAFNGYLVGAYLVRRRLRLTLWTTATLITLVLVAWCGWVGYGSYRLSRAITAWEEVGGTLNPSQPIASTVPDRLNAALVYRELANLRDDFRRIHFDDESHEFVRSQWDPELRDTVGSIVTLDELRALIIRHRSTIDRVTQATRMPHCQWERPVVSDRGRAAAFMYADLIWLAAMERIVSGDDRAGSEHLLTLIRFAHQLTQDATWLEEPYGILSMATSEMHRLRFDSDVPWDIFDEELQRWDGGEIVSRSLVNLSSLYAEVYVSPDQVNVSDGTHIARKFGLLKLDFAMFLETARQWHDEALTSTSDGGRYPGYPEPTWYRPWCGEWRFADRSQFDRRDWIDVERDVARIAIKVIQHRQSQGMFPESIKGLIESDLCPVNGDPYGYKYWDGGFMIIIPRDQYGPYRDIWGLIDPEAASNSEGTGSDEPSVK